MLDSSKLVRDSEIADRVAQGAGGDRRDSVGAASLAGVADPELSERPRRRRFTAEYKLGVLREAEACTRKGEIGAMLRREGLYSSHLTAWRKQRDAGALVGLAPRKRGPRGASADYASRPGWRAWPTAACGTPAASPTPQPVGCGATAPTSSTPNGTTCFASPPR